MAAQGNNSTVIDDIAASVAFAMSLGISPKHFKQFMGIHLRSLEDSMRLSSMAADFNKCKAQLSNRLAVLLLELVALHGKPGKEAETRRNAICDEEEVDAFIALLSGPKALAGMSSDNYFRLLVVVEVLDPNFFE